MSDDPSRRLNYRLGIRSWTSLLLKRIDPGSVIGDHGALLASERFDLRLMSDVRSAKMDM